MNEFKPRWVITGSSRGLGRAIAIEAASRGAAWIVVNYRVRRDMALETCRMVEREGAECRVVGADVSRWDDARKLVSEAVDFMGGIDVLVNNAGVLGAGEFSSLKPSDWERVIGVNLLGPFNVTRAALDHLSSGSVVVNIASVLGVRPEAEASVYSASKAGLIAWSMALAKELAPRIRVLVIAPGGIDTDMAREWGDLSWVEEQVPLKRLAEPREIARLVVDAVTNPYITGDVLFISGGLL